MGYEGGEGKDVVYLGCNLFEVHISRCKNITRYAPSSQMG